VPLIVGMVWGPTLVADHSFTIGEMVEQFLMGKVPGVAKMQVPIVDIRDAAIAHLNSILNEAVTDERIIIVGANIWFKEFAEIMNENYRKHGYNVKTGEIKFWMLKVASWIDDTAKSIIPQWNKEQVLSAKKSIQTLGMQYRPARETIIEMCDSFIDMGIVKDKRKKK
jgi:nucleoside-diphosphate-sugar epimerase